MSVCKIKTIPDLNLAIPSVSVYSFNQNLKKLSIEMHKLMVKKKGIGIAAPQCNFNLRVLVLDSQNFDKVVYNKFKVEDRFLCIVNPSLKLIKESIISIEEGCLSLPSAEHFKVPRYEEITISAFDIKGEEHTVELKGTPSIILQHEMDHLDGILYPFRLDSDKCREILFRYGKYNLIQADKIESFIKLNEFFIKKNLSKDYNYEELYEYCSSQGIHETSVNEIWKNISYVNNDSLLK